MTRRLPIVVLERAKTDLIASAIDIADNSDSAALRFVDAFDATLLAIASYPHSGPVVQVAGSQLLRCRSWPLLKFKNWRVFYRIESDRIEVVRLLHAARNLDSID